MICNVCGASWACEHQPDPDRARLVYAPPDSDTLGQQAAAVAHQFKALVAGMKIGQELVDRFGRCEQCGMVLCEHRQELAAR